MEYRDSIAMKRTGGDDELVIPAVPHAWIHAGVVTMSSTVVLRFSTSLCLKALLLEAATLPLRIPSQTLA